MRAVVVHEFGSLEAVATEEVPDPVPSASEVLLEAHAVPVNYVDLLTMSGGYQFQPALPYIPGKGPAGVVRGVGADVTGVGPGDRVLAMAEYGGYAELVTVDARNVYRLPDELSFTGAAAMSLAFDTAWMALRDRATLRRGETVLVLGATGAVGGAAVQLAKGMGAGLVLAGAARSGSRAALAELGADGFVDLSGGNLRESIRDQVLQATSGTGVDVVIDPVGGDAFDGAIRALAWRGRLVVVGFAAGRIPTLKVNYALLKNIAVSGLQISDYRKRTPELMAECYREVFELYRAGQLTAPPATTFPLTQWRTAVEAAATRGAGRLVLLPR